MSFSLVLFVGVSLAVTYGPQSVFSCDGYAYEEIYLKSKDSNELLLTEHKPAVLTPKCTIRLNGCIETTREIKGKIKVDWNITKDGNQNIVGHEDDMCEGVTKISEEDKNMLAMMGVPLECPVPKGKKCKRDEEVDLSHHRSNLVMMEGNNTGMLTFTSDTGTSVFEFSNSITKKE